MFRSRNVNFSAKLSGRRTDKILGLKEFPSKAPHALNGLLPSPTDKHKERERFSAFLKTRNIKFPDPNAVTAPAPRRNRFTRFERLPRGRQPNLAVDASVRPRRPERLARPVPALRLPQRPRGLLPGGMPKNVLRTSRHGARCLLPRVSE